MTVACAKLNTSGLAVPQEKLKEPAGDEVTAPAKSNGDQ